MITDLTELPEITVEGIHLIPANMQVLIDGQDVKLTKQSFLLLHALLKMPNRILTPEIIQDVTYGEPHFTSSAIRWRICSLRKKLGSYGDRLENVLDVGYRFTQKET